MNRLKRQVDPVWWQTPSFWELVVMVSCLLVVLPFEPTGWAYLYAIGLVIGSLYCMERFIRETAGWRRARQRDESELADS
jgi:hypothetical protein